MTLTLPNKLFAWLLTSLLLAFQTPTLFSRLARGVYLFCHSVSPRYYSLPLLGLVQLVLPCLLTNFFSSLVSAYLGKAWGPYLLPTALTYLNPPHCTSTSFCSCAFATARWSAMLPYHFTENLPYQTRCHSPEATILCFVLLLDAFTMS